MEIHQLRYLLAIGEEGSFTAAAAREHVSQSGLSTQVAKLERELGHRLLDRGRHGATPTRVGNELLQRISEALAAVEAVAATAHELSGAVVGSVRFAAVVGCDLPWLGAALSAFAARHPGVHLTCSEGASDQLVEALLARRLDLALVGHTGALPAGVETVEVVTSELVVVHDGRVTTRRATAATLDRHPVATLPPGTGVRDALDSRLARTGTVLHPTFEVHSPGMVLDLAARGPAIGVLTAGMLEDPLPEGLEVTPFSPRTESHLSIAYLRDPDAATRNLLAFVTVCEPSGPSRP